MGKRTLKEIIQDKQAVVRGPIIRTPFDLWPAWRVLGYVPTIKQPQV